MMGIKQIPLKIFVDDILQEQLSLDAIVTVVDAKHDNIWMR